MLGGSSSSYGSSPNMFFYFVADPDGRVTARLPGETDGFTEDGLNDFTRAAGLDQVRVRTVAGTRVGMTLVATVWIEVTLIAAGAYFTFDGRVERRDAALR